jgi:hypothetical protein
MLVRLQPNISTIGLNFFRYGVYLEIQPKIIKHKNVNIFITYEISCFWLNWIRWLEKLQPKCNTHYYLYARPTNLQYMRVWLIVQLEILTLCEDILLFNYETYFYIIVVEYNITITQRKSTDVKNTRCFGSKFITHNCNVMQFFVSRFGISISQLIRLFLCCHALAD